VRAEHERLLGRFLDYLRQQGYSVCERVSKPDGAVRHRALGPGHNAELIAGFAAREDCAAGRGPAKEGQHG
jgi:hypothetical protein